MMKKFFNFVQCITIIQENLKKNIPSSIKGFEGEVFEKGSGSGSNHYFPLFSNNIEYANSCDYTSSYFGVKALEWRIQKGLSVASSKIFISGLLEVFKTCLKLAREYSKKGGEVKYQVWNSGLVSPISMDNGLMTVYIPCEFEKLDAWLLSASRILNSAIKRAQNHPKFKPVSISLQSLIESKLLVIK